MIMLHRSNRVYLIAGLAFSCGCMFYLFCRNPLIISVLEWLIPRLTHPVILSIRASTIPACAYLPIAVQDALPDGLWSFAYAAVISQLWFGHTGWMAYFWLGTIPFVCVGYEVLQVGDVIPGSFSWADLHFCLTGMMLGILLVIFYDSQKRLVK